MKCQVSVSNIPVEAVHADACLSDQFRFIMFGDSTDSTSQKISVRPVVGNKYLYEDISCYNFICHW